MLVRGVSLFLGGYPNEFTLISDINNGKKKYPWQIWLYLGFMIVVALVGAFVQFRFTARKKKTDKYDYYSKV